MQKIDGKKKFFKGQFYSKSDPYYRKAKCEGYRARSAYKLLQVDEEFNIFQGVERSVDLCAAPGSWSQVLANRLYTSEEERHAAEASHNYRVVSVDLQEMAPINGVSILQGDITTEETLQAIFGKFQGKKADLVVCDGAPDVTGFHEIDQYLQAQLLQAALMITVKMLREGGTFCAKFFKMHDLSYLHVMMKQVFKDVYVVKPESSRSSSAEAFVVGLGFNSGGKLVMSDSMQALKQIEESKDDEEEDALTF